MSLTERMKALLADNPALDLQARREWAPISHEIILKPLPKDTKVFEVHHEIEAARAKFFEQFLAAHEGN